MDKRGGIKKGGNAAQKSQPSWVYKRYCSCQHKALQIRLCLPLYKYNFYFLPGLDEKAPDAAEEDDTSEAVIRKESLKVSTN